MNPHSYYPTPGSPNYHLMIGCENNVPRRSLLRQSIFRNFWFSPTSTENFENSIFGQNAYNSISTVSQTPPTRYGSQNRSCQQLTWIYSICYPQVAPVILPLRIFPDISRDLLFPEPVYGNAHLAGQVFRNVHHSEGHSEQEVSSSIESNAFQAANFTFGPYGQIGQEIRRDGRCEINEEIDVENISFNPNNSMDWQDDHLVRHSFPEEEPFELRPPQVFDAINDNSTPGTLVPECLRHGIFVFHSLMPCLLSRNLNRCRMMVMNPWEFSGAPLCTCNFNRSAQSAGGPLQRNPESANQAFANNFAANYLTAENGFPIRDLTSQVGPLNLSAQGPPAFSRKEFTTHFKKEHGKSTQSQEEHKESTQPEEEPEEPTQSQIVLE